MRSMDGYHDDEADGALVPEDLITPAPDRAHAFDGCDAIVGDEDFVDDFSAVESLDELLGRGQSQVLAVAVLKRQMDSRHRLA